MSSFGTVPLLTVWAMLDECAKGHGRKARKHDWLITWQSRSYWGFPLGEHGTRKNPDIQIGHVRQLVGALQIDKDCAGGHITALRPKKPKDGERRS